MVFSDLLEEKILVYDGSKGAVMMRMGLAGGECADLWNIRRPEKVFGLYTSYVEAGADVIQTNTMQGSRYHLEARGIYEKLRDINSEGVRLAVKAVRDSGRNCLVAASIGPLGGLMSPVGDLTFDDAVYAFSEQIESVSEAGADILHFETFTDLAELRAAVFAARSVTSLPVIATMSYMKNGVAMMGDDAYLSALFLKAFGVSCAGANCLLYPDEMLPVLQRMAVVGVPLCSKPNGENAEHSDVETFYRLAFDYAACGVRLMGGCCGSGPEHVAAIRKAVDEYSIGGKGNTSPSLLHFGCGEPAGEEAPPQYITYHPVWIERWRAREMLISPKQAIKATDAAQAIAGGLAYTISPDALEDEEDVIAALIIAEKGDAKVCVVSFEIANENERYSEGATVMEREKERLVALSKQIAVNAKLYLSKPIVIKTNVPEVLENSLRYYCGIAGTDVGMQKRSAHILMQIAEKYKSVIIAT
ncbi:MAG: homocysteine S-methyltransferase family protein [Synergistaceae bacterium]|nr:homocysteine S-methyltransferase family protein [Synergistaceae bacterium]